MRTFIAAMYSLATMVSATQTHAQTAEESPAEIRFDTFDVPETAYTLAAGINNRGVAVGSYVDLSGWPRFGFMAIDGLFTTLRAQTHRFDPEGINDSGHVVGYEYETATGVLYENGVYSALEMPGTRPQDINNRGQIVGFRNNDTQSSGFLLSGGRYTTIQYPRSLSSAAYGINDRGQIVGDYSGADGISHGFVSLRGRFTAINVPDHAHTSPRDINNLGQVVGMTTNSSGVDDRGFLLWKGQFTIIQIPGSTTTVVNAINDSGRIVGTYVDSAGRSHGFEADVYQFVSLVQH